jgi:hypothetical protein
MEEHLVVQAVPIVMVNQEALVPQQLELALAVAVAVAEVAVMLPIQVA